MRCIKFDITEGLGVKSTARHCNPNNILTVLSQIGQNSPKEKDHLYWHIMGKKHLE